MTEPRSETAFEARLRDLLAAELRAAEADFPFRPLPATRPVSRSLSAAGLLATLVLLVGAVLLIAQLLGPGPLGPGGPALGPDGLPTSIDGEPVLRGPAIAARLGESGAFLAAGYVELGSTPCPSPAAGTSGSGGCQETWRLAESIGSTPSETFVLADLTAAPGFVRTSGAPTVLRVVSARAPAASGAVFFTSVRGADLRVEAVVWRQPTKGPIPDAAVPAAGGEVNGALVPDFVSALGQDGVTIAGYVPKRFLIGGADRLVPGTLANPPQQSPIPVYGEDLTTLVGHMVPGRGFVPLGSTGTATPTATSALSPTPPPDHGVIETGPDGLRTFTMVPQPDGRPPACDLILVSDPVKGTLEGQAGTREPIWLVADDGRHLSVVWPEGFSVRFEPDAVLYDESGNPVGRAGSRIILDQVPWSSATGTYDDPYIASGLLFGGKCYPFAAAAPSRAAPTASPTPMSSSLDGAVVLSGSAIAAAVGDATDDTPFLIEGFVTFIQADCFVPPDLPTSPLTAPCMDGWILSDTPWPEAARASGSATPPSTGYRLVVGSGIARWPPDLGASVVLRVHVRDPRAAGCAPSIRTACERAIVVEAAVGPGLVRAAGP